MMIVYEVPALAEQIRKSYGAIQIIGIDGCTEAGKTKLADRLSMLLDADVVSTDDHVKIRGGNREYVDRLNLEGIKDSVEKSIRDGRRVILEGICLRKVIARLAIPTDSIVHVYVKRMSKNSVDGVWCDEGDLEDFIREGRVEGRSHLDLIIFKYHEKFCPHEVASFEYQRQE